LPSQKITLPAWISLYWIPSTDSLADPEQNLPQEGYYFYLRIAAMREAGFPNEQYNRADLSVTEFKVKQPGILILNFSDKDILPVFLCTLYKLCRICGLGKKSMICFSEIRGIFNSFPN